MRKEEGIIAGCTALYMIATLFNVWIWNGLIEERKQISIAFDYRLKDSEAIHAEYAKLEDLEARLLKREQQMIEHVDATAQTARNIDDHIAELDDTADKIQRVHREFRDAWLNQGRQR